MDQKNGQKWPPIKKPNGPFDRARYAISKNGLTFVPRPKMAEMAQNFLFSQLLAIFGPIWPSCEAAMGPYDYSTHTYYIKVYQTL